MKFTPKIFHNSGLRKTYLTSAKIIKLTKFFVCPLWLSFKFHHKGLNGLHKGRKGIRINILNLMTWSALGVNILSLFQKQAGIAVQIGKSKIFVPYFLTPAGNVVFGTFVR